MPGLEITTPLLFSFQHEHGKWERGRECGQENIIVETELLAVDFSLIVAS